MRQPLLVRADANSRIGTGHVMRCLALAQAWKKDGAHAIFVATQGSEALKERLAREGIECISLAVAPAGDEDARQTALLARGRGASWVVVDGYHFGTAFHGGIRAADLSLLVVDDDGCPCADADLVLNQNLHAQETYYPSRGPATRLLLGTRYALLREDFLGWQNWQRATADRGCKVLVTLGGGDHGNQTAKVLAALAEVGRADLEARVLVGAANPHLESLQHLAASLRFKVELLRGVTNVPELMAWADLAISAGGSTCWELAALGTPSIILVLADNQQRIAASLMAAGAALNLGKVEEVSVGDIARALATLLESSSLRRGMTDVGRGLVDARGAQRVVEVMASLPRRG
jgi:UDP-2,4-diacetamido-2,4,6-trideoxy-beta-L-altropyranose hydrolase